MYNKYILLLSFVLLSVALWGQPDSISTKVALQISDVKITEYEFEKNFNIFKSDYFNKFHKQPGKEEIKIWIQSFIDRTYFLADAYKKGYPLRNDINKKVVAMEHFIISQPGGLLEKIMEEKKYKLNENEIEKAIQKSKKKISVEYLKFMNLDSAKAFIGATQLKNKEEFKKYVDRSSVSKNIIHKEEDLTWPFQNFWEYDEYIHGLRKDDLTPLLSFRDGCYVFFVKNVDTIGSSQSKESFKNYIINALAAQNHGKLQFEYTNEVNTNTTVLYNYEAFLRLTKILKITGNMHEFDKSLFNDMLQLNAFTYRITGSDEIYVSVDELIDYYNGLPMRNEIKDSVQLYRLCKMMVFDEYSYRKAREFGITQQPKFLLDKDNYLKEQIYSKYETDELKNAITITGDEITNKYNTNKDTYAQATNVIVSVFSFDNRADAVHGMFTIPNMADSSSLSNLKGIRNVDWHINIAFDSKLLPKSIIETIFNLKNKGVSKPLQADEKYLIFFKESEYGHRIKSLDEVKPKLVKEIEGDKLLTSRQNSLIILKKQYAIKNGIDYQKYIGK